MIYLMGFLCITALLGATIYYKHNSEYNFNKWSEMIKMNDELLSMNKELNTDNKELVDHNKRLIEMFENYIKG